MEDYSEIAEVLSSFRDAIDLLMSKIDAMDQMYHALDDKTHELEKVLYDDIVNPALDAFDEAETEDRFNQFHERHGEKLDAYNEPLRSIEGDDFDLSRQAFNDYDALEGEKPDEDEYVDALTKQVDEQLEKIRDSVGAKEVTATTDEDGNTTIEADGEVVATDDEGATNTEEGSVEEKPTEEAPAEEEKTEEPAEEGTADEDEMEALMNELREAKKSF